MKTRHGFVVFDQLASNRLGDEYFNVLQARSRQVFYEQKEPNGNVWVFQF